MIEIGQIYVKKKSAPRFPDGSYKVTDVNGNDIELTCRSGFGTFSADDVEKYFTLMPGNDKRGKEEVDEYTGSCDDLEEDLTIPVTVVAVPPHRSPTVKAMKITQGTRAIGNDRNPCKNHRGKKVCVSVVHEDGIVWYIGHNIAGCMPAEMFAKYFDELPCKNTPCKFSEWNVHTIQLETRTDGKKYVEVRWRGVKARASCHPDDQFVREVGIMVAIGKLAKKIGKT